MVDVGCGIGGSSRAIVRKYGAHAQGITLSPKQVNQYLLNWGEGHVNDFTHSDILQAQRAGELAQQQGLGQQCLFRVGDALAQPFEDNSFDLVWSLER